VLPLVWLGRVCNHGYTFEGWPDSLPIHLPFLFYPSVVARIAGTLYTETASVVNANLKYSTTSPNCNFYKHIRTRILKWHFLLHSFTHHTKSYTRILNTRPCGHYVFVCRIVDIIIIIHVQIIYICFFIQIVCVRVCMFVYVWWWGKKPALIAYPFIINLNCFIFLYYMYTNRGNIIVCLHVFKI
jgi:hypothetical protein